MATIVDRDEIVPILTAEYAAIAELCGSFDEAQWDTPTCLPGWSVKDNLSHMVGTESMLAGVKTPKVDISHLTHLRNGIAEANEAWVESLRAVPGAEVLARFRAITAERLGELAGMDQVAFDAPSWTPAGPDETYGRFMRIRHYDCYHHELDMRAAVGAPDRTDVDHISMALAELAEALGYIVGKKVGVRSGSSVAIHLVGPVKTSYFVEVGDRARQVDQLSGAPTASITLDPNLFLRLTGGRCDAEPWIESGDLLLGGEADLARRLATQLAYTL